MTCIQFLQSSGSLGWRQDRMTCQNQKQVLTLSSHLRFIINSATALFSYIVIYITETLFLLLIYGVDLLVQPTSPRHCLIQSAKHQEVGLEWPTTYSLGIQQSPYKRSGCGGYGWKGILLKDAQSDDFREFLFLLQIDMYTIITHYALIRIKLDVKWLLLEANRPKRTQNTACFVVVSGNNVTAVAV